MFLTILVVLFLIAGIAAITLGVITREVILGGIGVGVTTLAIIVGLMASFTIIQPRSVGVNVAFGKPVATLENGFHFIAPWSKVEKLDLAIQNDIYNGDNTVSVRLANSSQAKVDASIQWQLKAEGAEEAFMDFRSFDAIKSNIVDRNFRAALNEVMAGYDPLTFTDTGDNTQDLAAIADDVKAAMEDKAGDTITVRSVTIPIINYDESTQKRIDELQTETAKTRIAEQKQDTARAESEANDMLTDSLTSDVLTSKCLDIIADNGQSPLGCFPGTNAQPVINANK